MKIRQGHYIKLDGLTKEQHTAACRAFIAAGARPYEDENYYNRQHWGYLGWDVDGDLTHYSTPIRYGRHNTKEITYEELVAENTRTSPEIGIPELVKNVYPLFPCQNTSCAEEMSWHKADLRMFKEEPICQECFNQDHYPETSSDSMWIELPPFIPEFEKTIQSQQEEIERLNGTDIFSPILDNMARDADQLQARVKELEAALDAIAHPIKYIQAEARRQGCTINGQGALGLSNDASYLKSIAKQALAGPSKDEQIKALKEEVERLKS